MTDRSENRLDCVLCELCEKSQIFHVLKSVQRLKLAHRLIDHVLCSSDLAKSRIFQKLVASLIRELLNPLNFNHDIPNGQVINYVLCFSLFYFQ